MDETKKSHKVRNIILIILAIILVIMIAVGIYYGRNYFMIEDILSKQASLKDCTNYSFTTEDTSGESTQTVDYQIKDGKQLLTIHSDELNYKMWYDRQTKELISFSLDSKVATSSSVEDTSFMITPLPLIDSEDAKWNLTFSAKLGSAKVNGVDCYKIEVDGSTQYYAKESGLLMRSESSATVDGTTYDSIINFKNWQINALTDDDVRKPDLTDYTVTNM